MRGFSETRLEVDLAAFTWLRPTVQRKNRAKVPVSVSVLVLLSASAIAGNVSPLRKKVRDILTEVAEEPSATDAPRRSESIVTAAPPPSTAQSSSKPWRPFADRARAVLERAASLEEAGSKMHITLAEEQALTWAEAARDLKRTVQVEQEASQLERELLSARQTLSRAEALLEETSIRRHRAEAQLKALDRSLTKKATPDRGQRKTGDAR